MNYIITGAGGHLGSTILRQLMQNECEINALILPGETAKVENRNIHYTEGNICCPESLIPLFERAKGRETTVIHTAGVVSISSSVTGELYDVNVKGTGNIIDLCRRYYTARLVYVSSVHAIPELPVGETITEVEKYPSDVVIGGYARTKAQATQLVLDASGRGMDAVVVCPSGIIGPYDEGRNHLIQLISSALEGRLPACVRGGYDFVDVRDVAYGCLAAAEKGKSGNSYILSGHYATIEDMLEILSSITGCRMPPVIPLWMARIAAPVIENIARRRGRRPIYTRYSLYTLVSNSCFSHGKASAELGYCPRGLADTLRDTAEWLRMHKPGQ